MNPPKANDASRIEIELREGALQFKYREVVVGAHKMPVFTDDEDRGWSFAWIGGHSYDLNAVLTNIDQLLLSGYIPGNSLPCKNCSQQVELEFWEEIPGLSNHQHVDGHYDCEDGDILPTTPPARCHICKIVEPPHNPECSAGGFPRHAAEPSKGL